MRERENAKKKNQEANGTIFIYNMYLEYNIKYIVYWLFSLAYAKRYSFDASQ